MVKKSKATTPTPRLLRSLERHRERGVPFRAVSELVPWIENPRDNAAAVPSVIASMQEFGWTNPVLYRADGRMVEAGHTRLLAAAHLGLTEVPAIALDHDERAARLYALADNRLNELAPWTSGIADLMAGYDSAELAIAGFDDPAAWLASEFGDPLAGDSAPGESGPVAVPPSGPSLAERFGVPPFSVLDARGGYWAERKKRWMALGLRSGEGREDAVPILQSLSGRVPNYYAQKRAAQARVGREMSNAEFEAEHLKAPESSSISTSGISVFDPVLAELLVRWFSPPGGLVLDPFAGGSVRGIVSAACGRRYLGIDLRREQVEANERQWEEIGPGLSTISERTAPEDYTPDVTPVERHGGYLFKREDSWVRSGARGAKSRTMFRVCEMLGAKGLVSAGARISPQIERAAMVAQALGIPCRVHTGVGAPTSETETAARCGAEVIRTGTRLNMYLSACKKDAAARPDWALFPFGMGIEEYAEDVAYQAERLPWGDFERLVAPCGSGMTLAGILRGMERAGKLGSVPVVAVSLGHKPDDYLDRFAPAGWRDFVTFVDGGRFEERAAVTRIGSVDLDPMYEAKAIPHLRDGDLLWVVGLRESGYAPTLSAAPPKPTWVAGDSRAVVPTLDVQADFVLSCPPYADLEVYSDDPLDISNMPYPEFLLAYREIIRDTVAKLRPNAFVGWVVGEVRDPKTGLYRGFVPDTVRAFEDAGARFYNEAVLVTSAGSAAIRVTRSFEGSRKIGKVHQNVLVFVKGDPRLATEAIGKVSFGAVEEAVIDG